MPYSDTGQILLNHLKTVQPNLALGWLWIVLGFAFGAVLGMFFHQEEWMGGYGSFKRRMYRLSHISFFGLAIINLLFYFTIVAIKPNEWGLLIASRAFMVGAITMPICCIIMAHFPKAQALFAIPVSSLILAGVLTFLKVVNG